MCGKQNNQTMRSSNYDGSTFSFWKKFEARLAEQTYPDRVLTSELKEVFQEFRQEKFCQRSFDKLQQQPEFNTLYQAFCQFTASLQAPVARLSLSYFQMVQLPLCYTRSIKTADRKLHLASICKILPRCLRMITLTIATLCHNFGVR